MPEPRSPSSVVARPSPRIPLLIFALLAVLVGAAGDFVFRENSKFIAQNEIQNLGAIADLKVAQITAWSASLHRRANLFMNGSMLAVEFDGWLKEGMPDLRKRQILGLLLGIQSAHSLAGITVFDAQGKVRIRANEVETPDAAAVKLVRDAMLKQKVMFVDLHRDTSVKGGAIRIDYAAPLLVPTGKGDFRTVGAVLMAVDPDSFLYPVIQAWPTPSQSAETLLARRDGDDILYLNELRHQKGSALTLRFPLATSKVPPAMWLRGELNAMKGVDYRGVPVFTAIRQVPGTPWIMVSKIDQDELLAPIRILKNWVIFVAAILVATGGLLIVVWHQRKQVQGQRLKEQQDAELERMALLKHFEYLTRFGNDIVVLADDEGRIVEANDRAAAAYGYSTEKLKGMPIQAGMPADREQKIAEIWEEIKRRGSLMYESVHLRKDGTEFPVESSVRQILIGGKAFYQAIVRDISERKQVEKDLKFRHALLAALKETSPDGILVVDEGGKILIFNQRFVDMWGIPPIMMASASDEEAIRSVIDKVAAPQQFLDKIAHLYAHKQEISQDEISLRDGRVFERNSGPVVGHGGQYYGRVWFFHDITERKRSEEALRQQKNFILQVIDADPNLIFVKDARGKFLLVNQAMTTLHGKTAQEIIGMDSAELFRSREEAEPHLQADRKAIETGLPVTFVANNFMGGKEHWFHVTKVPMKQSDGSVNVLGVVVDVTASKLAEEKLSESYRELERVNTRLEEVKEDEQKRIARELHDEMGSILTALNIHVFLLAQEIPDEMDRLRAKTDALAKLVVSAVQIVSHIVARLRPYLLDEVGLKGAIEQHVDEFRKNTGIQCQLRLPEAELKLDQPLSAALFRIIQEALTNVTKYAEASEVSIVLSDWDDSLFLTIKDNGKGFDIQQVKAQSFGLAGIRERAVLMNGKAEIISAPGKGTTVRVIMKLGVS